MILSKLKAEAKRAKMGDATKFCISVPIERVKLDKMFEIIVEHVQETQKKWQEKFSQQDNILDLSTNHFLN